MIAGTNLNIYFVLINFFRLQITALSLGVAPYSANQVQDGILPQLITRKTALVDLPISPLFPVLIPINDKSPI